MPNAVPDAACLVRRRVDHCCERARLPGVSGRVRGFGAALHSPARRCSPRSRRSGTSGVTVLRPPSCSPPPGQLGRATGPDFRAGSDRLLILQFQPLTLYHRSGWQPSYPTACRPLLQGSPAAPGSGAGSGALRGRIAHAGVAVLFSGPVMSGASGATFFKPHLQYASGRDRLGYLTRFPGG